MLAVARSALLLALPVLRVGGVLLHAVARVLAALALDAGLGRGGGSNGGNSGRGAKVHREEIYKKGITWGHQGRGTFSLFVSSPPRGLGE